MKWLAALLAAVVVAMIAFPLFAQPRQGGGPGHHCFDRIRGLATAMMIYANYNDGRLPLEDWADSSPYIKEEALHCPQAAKYGYAMNMDVVGKQMDYASPRNETAVLLFDTDALGRNVVANLAARSRNRHGKGSIVCYLDNHAKWVGGDQAP